MSNFINKFLALFFIFIFFPIFIFIWIFIFFEDGCPVFFSQLRVGSDRMFLIYKFRSMKKHTPIVATHLLLNPENYLLRTGKIIRKLSLDELPNLFNIVKGDMVFVGPRPALYNQSDLILLRKSFGVDKLKPGITGWAQINGRDELSLDKKVQFDKEYLDNKSIYFDFKILFFTIGRVLFKNGISH